MRQLLFLKSLTRPRDSYKASPYKWFSSFVFNRHLENLFPLFAGLSHKPNTIVSFENFQRISKQILRESKRERRLKKVFQEFDAEKKGYIEVHGIKRVLRRLRIDHTESDIDLMMKMADTKGDGRVYFEEFLQIFSESDDI